ncbi:sugar porter family MFS transporter [Alteromonas sp. KUL106]|uniref:sugar porter family MFS transporter n=1 Tax=Alteromonas sp. KUL106 TaxID=2480799 RepID=UPI0012E6C483|nr:sugar porter family MFS transporter [Alteromonas sp. KUL106]GFD68568.1 MFS transporter [Alteromonas sp. KUL106]GFD79567.1 MFS transporter [Tenacibaculum sp. KUL118]
MDTTLTNNIPSDSTNTGFILFITIVATIGGFLFGFDSGVINGTVDGLQTAFNSQSVGTGFNVSSMLLGCAIGAFFAGRLADQYGRKSLLLVAAVFFVVSAWGSGIATSSVEFVIYRVIGGLAVGAASVMAPAYIAEVSPAKYRGMLASIQQIAIIGGLFTAFLSNYFLADIASGSTQKLWLEFEAWRWMFWMELVPASLFFIMLLFIPESPRFLVVKQKNGKASTVLAKLYGEKAQSKLSEIEATLSNDHKPQLKDLIHPSSGKLKPIVWVGIGLAALQQLVGINVVFYYGAVLWQAVGFSESDALLINVLSGAISIAACLVALAVIDKIGRKPLLKWGSIGMTATLAVVTIAFLNAEQSVDGKLSLNEWGPIALIAANLYVFCFNFSWGPVMWVMLGEMFPNQIRGSGLAVSGLVQWSTNFLITWSFPMLLAGIGLAGAYGLYAIFSMLSIIFVVRYVYETKGVELEDMQG